MNYWWQKHNHKDAWRYLIEDVKPDIALLQEVVVPEEYENQTVFLPSHTSRESSGIQWGTAIYINPQIVVNFDKKKADRTAEFLPENDFKGKTVVVEIHMKNGGRLFVISLHTDTDNNRAKYGTPEDTTVKNLRSILYDQDLLRKIESNYIFGGDFNIDKDMYSKCYDATFNDFEKNEMHECLTPAIQTYFNFNMSPKNHFQDDHLFVHNSMATKVKDCFAWNYGKVKHYSDHTIVEMEFNS
jgi:endonuclease/exonuclease/phosphatase family metal-dependent hydrolase